MGRTSSAVFNINYHLVWCPKYRKPILVEYIKDFLKDCLETICEAKGWKILDLSIQNDHLHLFISTTPEFSPTMIVKVLKGVSSLQLFKKFPELKKEYWNGHLWSPSYYVGTAGKVTSETVRRYIEEQERNSSSL
jgi:putative transposase